MEVGGGNPAERCGDATTQRPASSRRVPLALQIIGVLADYDCTAHKLSEEIIAKQSSIDYALRRLIQIGLVEKAGLTKRTKTRPAVIWRLSQRLRGRA